MSYILDALRRAESERQRGQVPGLGAVPQPAPAVAGPAGSRAAWWAVIGLAVVGVAAAATWWLQRPAVLPVAGGADMALAVPQAAPRAPATAAAPAPASAPLAVPAAPALLPAAPAPLVLPRVVSAPPAAVPSPSPVPSPAPAPAGVPAEPAADKRPLKLSELAPQQRSEWPALTVGGSVWSDSAASRFVILNGQVLREGQAVQPGLTLERIQPRAALLRWRGLLVELPL